MRILAASLVMGLAFGVSPASAAPPMAAQVLTTYADIAQAMYGDAHTTAKTLQQQVDAFLADPTPAKLAAARAAWKAARVPYSQSEGFRFGNSVVDEWEPTRQFLAAG